MNAIPLQNLNITQTLFRQNEKMIIPSDSVSVAYQNLASLSGINSMPEEINNMHNQMPVFLSQAHLSTWYQDNPFSTLLYSKKFGLPPMGGNIELDQPPGHKPGNTFKSYNSPADNYPSIVENIKNTKIMRENFGNGENQIKIHWQ